MNCEDLQRKLLSGDNPQDAEILAHTGQCEACREFVGLRAGRAPDAPEPPDTELLRVGLREALAEEQGLAARLRSMPTSQRILLALCLVALVALVEGTVLVRADFDLVPRSVLIGLVLGLALLSVVGARAVLRPLYRPELGPRGRALLALFLLGSPILWSFVQPVTGHPASAEGLGMVFWKRAFGCCAHGLVLAAVMVLGLFLLDRRLLRSSWTPVAAGSLGGVVAAMGLQLHCPIPTSAHWLVGHASVGLLLVAALTLYRRLRGE